MQKHHEQQFWYLANRTAFGIRDDGNLIFAMGHHVSTKDLAKALFWLGARELFMETRTSITWCAISISVNEKDKIVKTREVVARAVEVHVESVRPWLR